MQIPRKTQKIVNEKLRKYRKLIDEAANKELEYQRKLRGVKVGGGKVNGGRATSVTAREICARDTSSDCMAWALLPEVCRAC